MAYLAETIPQLNSLLTTKPYIPRTTPRLLARLGEGLRRKLTLIFAPTGFGKTTLLGEWLGQQAEAQSSGGAEAKDLPSVPLHPCLVVARRGE